MLNKIVAFFGSVEVHRIAAAVAVVAVAVQGFLSVNGTSFGIDPATLQTVLGVVGAVVVAAHEFQNPVVLPFLKALRDGPPKPA